MIEKNINEVLVKNEPSARALLTSLYEIDEYSQFNGASVYHQFPIYPNLESDKAISANVIFLSQEHGIFIFQCVDASREQIRIDDYVDKLNEIDRLIFAKILKESPLLQLNRRSLKVNITPVIYFNGATQIPATPNDIAVVASLVQLKDLILNNSNELSEIEFRDLKATIEGSKGIPRVSDRIVKDPLDLKNSKGAILSKIENDIYNFDLEQKRAALFVIDGAQRIRGLAGSGKTVILAMKAAIIHLQYPNANILYTYYTKSLHELIRALITRFYRQFAERDPNWERVQIMHAWGGKYLEGVYYNTCKNNSFEPISYGDAKIQRPKDPFDFVCEKLNTSPLKKQYDYSLLDEAQDFPQNFYRVCRQITNNNRVIWAYDDFQNILRTELQNEKETFGTDEFGKHYIDFSKREDELQDMILHKCYRTPRKILILAFSLGLGIYNKNKNNKFQVLQRLESNEHWESLGFKIEEGDSSDKSPMVITRPTGNSSVLKNELLGSDIILRVKKCEDFGSEVDFVFQAILDDLALELNPEDITVVCMDNFNVKNYFNALEELLHSKNISVFNLSKASPSNTVFKVKNHVTLSTIYNAKGNEAGSVYILGIETVFNEKNDITERNKIFTAITRSLAWVTMSGIGQSVDYCINEIEDLKSRNFELHILQPSEKDVKRIKQGIDKKQKLLNTIERLADDLVKETGLSKDEVVEQLKIKFYKK